MQDSKESAVPVIIKMGKGRDRKDIPIIFMPGEEREEVWDSLYIKEEGIMLEILERGYSLDPGKYLTKTV